MFISSAFHAVVDGAHTLIEGLATLLAPGLGGLAAAAAIVLFTVLVRLLVSPLSWMQARAAKRGAALAPEIARLRAKHRDDPMALATETLALQRSHGAGPGLSLLPALVQAPFFMIMFQLVQPGAGPVSGLLAGEFLGVPLTAHLVAGFPVFAGLLALATALAVWSSGRARQAQAVAPVLVPAGGGPASAQADAVSAAGRLMTYLPYLTILVVAYLPLAGAIYLVTSTAWTALEQALWRRPTLATNR
jgi:YidC/Oxa1 family membrane protein insertase